MSVKFDYRKLKGRIIEKFKTQGIFAKSLQQSERTVSLKLNSRVPFTDKEILVWCDKLSIPSEDINIYFFAPSFENEE